MKRLHNLDYLRGLAAFGIMIYHYMTAAFGQYDASSFLGRIGMYGVSIFYVLSGLTLYLVYHSGMHPSKTDIIAFAKKRFFRIFPLLWLVTISWIILLKSLPDLLILALNFSGLFGFFAWDKDIAPGVWSIGNELVFYVFFPLFIFLMNKSKMGLTILSLIILAIYLYFAFKVLDVQLSFVEQWRDYANPLNQLFLFLGGFLTGMFFRNIYIPPITGLIILTAGLCAFIFYPLPAQDTIILVTGFTRIVFTLLCFVICLGFYKTTITLPTVIHKALTLLGEASYSVYLLHIPVLTVTSYIFSISAARFYGFPVAIKMLTAITITLIVSYIVYKKFELFFIKLGKPKKPAMIKNDLVAPVGNNT